MLYSHSFSIALNPIAEFFASIPFVMLAASLVHAIFFVNTLTVSMFFFLTSNHADRLKDAETSVALESSE